jgi:APA family basic amino acid/polyamine antiporter
MSASRAPDSGGEGRVHEGAQLVRGLGPWDATSLTVGSVIGTGIFLVSSDIAKALPHGGMILAVFLVGGLLSLAGALTFAELGAMYPRAGGIYHYLKEAYGSLPGFLYGWACFLVIMSGGVAAIAIGFGEYLGAFWPFASSANVLASAKVFGWAWTLSGVQVVAVGAILFLTAVNHFGLKQGAALQNFLTVIKSAAIVGVGIGGLLVTAKSTIGISAPLPAPGNLAGGSLLAAFGIAMIAALWTYDGWYGSTFSAGEMRDPGRTLPIGLIGGTAIVMALYLLINLVYLRALPVEAMAGESRIGEAAVAALFGVGAGKALAAAVVLSTFGCLAATILYSSRIYQPMAADGLFFRSLATIDPVRRVPLASLWSQSIWAMLLTLSGTYSQLYTFSVFAGLLFHAAAGAAVLVLRRKAPELARPYLVWGYPVVPLLFLVAMSILIVNTVVERPVESLLGLGIVATGFPAFYFLRRSNRR